MNEAQNTLQKQQHSEVIPVLFFLKAWAAAEFISTAHFVSATPDCLKIKFVISKSVFLYM